MSATPMIQVAGVTKNFDSKTVLDGIHLDVHPGEIVAVIGPSGCGKSTLLRLMGGLDEPDTGSIELSDDNVTMVFQYSALFDSLTVFENVAFSLIEEPDALEKRRKQEPMSYREMRKLVKEKLALVGLHQVENLYPNELSGGMQKRVSFARAIVSNPKIILYDEPTAGLDPIATTMIENYILTLRDELGAASVVVTHDLSTIQRTADRVCLLFHGRIQWEGTSDEFFATEDPYARQFAHASLEGPMMPGI